MEREPELAAFDTRFYNVTRWSCDKYTVDTTARGYIRLHFTAPHGVREPPLIARGELLLMFRMMHDLIYPKDRNNGRGPSNLLLGIFQTPKSR